MSLTVKYIDTPEGAQANAQVTGSGGQAFSVPAAVAAGVEDIPWATLEPGGWPLDGTRRIMPDDAAPLGWWSSERSDENGAFAAVPTLDFDFSEPYTATGLTFVFSPSTGQWCSEVYVVWYNGNTLLAEITAYPDAAQWTLQQRVEGFDHIHIELRKTNNPEQFAKIQLIQIGQAIIFGRDELVSVHLVNEVDPALCELTVDTMKISIRDRKSRALVPQENQRMELYKDGNLMAVHYITGSSREAQYYYTFSCQSVLGLLEDDYLGGLYVDVPIEDILDDILDGRPYTLHESFSDMKITGYLPVCTRREALQQLVFAIGAVVTTQGSEAIRFIPLPDEIGHVFDGSKIFNGAKVETAPRYSRIEVASHSYKASATVETLLDGEEISGEDVLYTFESPHHDYSISGGTITGSGANWVTVTADGVVTLTAKSYLHSVTMHRKRNTAATAAERNNVLTVDEATLIYAGNVQDALNRLYTASQLRQTLTQEAVIKDHKAGEKVSSVNPWGTQTRGYITAMESDLTQTGHTAKVTILGVEVTAENVYYYAGELYAGDEEAPY